jgi:hypothetical protein
MSDPISNPPVSPEMPLIPACRRCGKEARHRDIDGDWWPPCRCGIAHLKYDDEK